MLPDDFETVPESELSGCAAMALIMAVFILILLFGSWLLWP